MSKHQQGFTLIELLIATSIMLMMLVMAMFGYQLYDKQWRKEKDNVSIAFTQLKTFDLFNSALHGIVPYLVNEKEKVGFYFLGKQDGFTAITTNPIVNTGYPAVIRIFTELDDVGQYRLVYEEASLKNTWLVGANQRLNFSERLVVLRDIKDIEFQYFAIPNASEPVEMDENDQIIDRRRWLHVHDGLTAFTHPEKVQINIAGFPIYASIASRAEAVAAKVATEAF
ncbi:hypothetical protein A5320_08150 [Rheinheimera sp. SA_1]|uniref:PulJ/GspJ family protein n=1 Tax=Rheinheimera sp. SA_1 TaxID=1827365 RepID=UPI0008008688|nr:prepilin-type N-terminal cleavage/methylation domain-containing protein [Rheinheimera sp. SA_1]OBP15326.1 hypothetical protein A5320_08150 [Rheinheimera sp. SA_1]